MYLTRHMQYRLSGSFTEEVEAARAYDKAVLRLRGQDARSRSRMNFPLSDYNLEELGVQDPPGLLALAAGGGFGLGGRSTPEPKQAARKPVRKKWVALHAKANAMAL